MDKKLEEIFLKLSDADKLAIFDAAVEVCKYQNGLLNKPAFQITELRQIIYDKTGLEIEERT